MTAAAGAPGGLTGRLSIGLTVADGAVRAHVDHRPGRPVAALLVGKPREQAAILVPAVLNLCAVAHRQAATAAVGLGHGDAAGTRQETVRDHAIAILRDWPACLGAPAEAGALRVVGALASGQAGAADALRRQIAGPSAGTGAELRQFTVAEMERWLAAGETATVRLLAGVRRRFDPAWGRAALPAPTLRDLEDAALPAREVTCADRVRGTPLLQAVEAAEGRSLFARLLGRVLDLLGWLDGGPDRPAEPAPPGTGLAEASRGLLIHRAALDGGRIAGYRIVTPTDWNLAGGGLLHRMLASLPADERLEPAARLVLACVDPCLPTELHLYRD